ncbi:vanillate demethylase subunit B [Rhodopseudomonas thermotolerans]|uniref:Vanillate demethylase subunit B n=2 Tax=Rhodopseudomonas TaxID=1073 RepID=A0A336JTH8_9BRAD|nr:MULTISPECIES: PDR/VanB family oxidoreductase [Rhodopseudomonas]RED30530.1 vanillate demethylase subunit B [Rhodopseudomonas pentothenatexigens]REF92634.1 vanillate demethylase subunit B [Rhodopseudomonas thermotolerans]SSW92063.1 vanillate demethylase subunit B [Rhodopseudomonas pentothenatexigens]
MRFAEQWTSSTVVSTRDLTPSIREIVLEPEAAVAACPPGSHINVAVLIDGRPDKRSYSLVGAPERGHLRIAVRLAGDSRGGSRAMWELKPGQRIDITRPTSLFEIDWSRKHYTLIAGGIGVTPMLGIAAALARRGADLTMHYSVRSRADAALHDELTGLLGGRLRIHAGDEGARLDLDATLRALPEGAVAVLCGPLRMLEAARAVWHQAGRPASDLCFETFGSSGRLPTTEFRVRIAATGNEIVVPHDRSMLDALNAAGFEVIFDCERGECGVCALDVTAVDGEIDHRDVFFSDHQKHDSAKMCTCVSRARGTVTIDTLYRPDQLPGAA